LNFDRTYLCNGTRYQQSERNLSIYRDSPTCVQTLVNLGPETAKNGWRVFTQPLHFRTGRLPSLLHAYNRQQTNFGTCYVVIRVCSLEQQNAGRAHVELCHASSFQGSATRKRRKFTVV